MVEDIESVLYRIEQDKQLLQELLDKQRQKKGHLLAVRLHMGETHSFVTSVYLKWIAEHVQFARQLPSLISKLDDANKVVIDINTLDLVQQREPDWRRQFPMVLYLAERPGHKFPPLLVAAWKPWVFNPDSNEWIKDKAKENSLTEYPLDSEKAYLDLDCTETQFYALDGQHRLMAILGLKKLLDEGILFARKKDGTNFKNKAIRLEDFGASQEDARSKIREIMGEKMGIEIIPAVQEGETESYARRRLRSIFVHVNKHAKKTTRGEQALLDEDDGFAVVARVVMVKHNLLKGRVEYKGGQLQEQSKFFTTLETLVEISKLWLKSHSRFKKWGGHKNYMPIRPEEGEIEEAQKELTEYFDLLCKLPSHQEILQDQSFSCSIFRTEKERENIFFRPIAQLALADALAKLRSKKNVDMQGVIKTMAEKEQQGEFRLKDFGSIWYGVLCDVIDQKIRRQKKYQTLCTSLLVYLLGGDTGDDGRKKLEADYRSARKIDEAAGKYINKDGKQVKAEEIELPEPWIILPSACKQALASES